MPTNEEYNQRREQFDQLLDELTRENAGALADDPNLAGAFIRRAREALERADAAAAAEATPADGGLSDLLGLSDDAPSDFGRTRRPPTNPAYDEQVDAERLRSVADLYYLYQHERLGVFKVILKLNQLYRAGTVKLSDGPGALRLYRYDRKQVLRYSKIDRLQAYRRVLGYTAAPPPPPATPNLEFHRLLVAFIREVAQFYRDRRISNVIRQRANDPSFGSIAVVRRAALDLRNNLKSASYGHVTPMRTETLQLLDEGFAVLNSPDVLRLFGSSDQWDVIEQVMSQYFNVQQIHASQRSRMAIAGRDILEWIASPAPLSGDRTGFETGLEEIAVPAEEWLTSAEALGVAGTQTPPRPQAKTIRQPILPPRPALRRPAGRNGNGRVELFDRIYG